ncbi:bifunctional methyltransferase/pyrophosphohydrolase YabN [Salimicrobium halophilum]|uniref:Tetrapyrrole methylase family protein / MazG family protein n=1 Tax=Salimicrobium halophilum TaxID=86666 RepID=A0A1G8W4V2_9BACI|nr:nucleoside triphosphate pyrophosphohydrolase [Salimicrobium halophilum]SDJ72530.1 tetrapyrrole methylase family protein / MazG family protein [Salimicrobium halophilum]
MGRIRIIGLGAGDIDQLPLGVYRTLTSGENRIFTRTMDHPAVLSLQSEGVTFKSFDEVYERFDSFEEVYRAITGELLEASEAADICYTVPGHPMVAERTVQLLLDQKDREVTVEGGQSFLDDTFKALRIDPIEGLQFIDATGFERKDVSYRQHTLFCQVYDTMIASEVKLTLLEDLPADYPVTIVTAAGSEKERVETVSLEELDREVVVDNLTSVYVPPANAESLSHQFGELRHVIARLRGPGGCPWDQKQTHASLKKYLIEEAYEVIEAIDSEDDEHLADELGDVLLQVMLHSQIGEDEGYFTIDDVIRSVTEKMIRRHPHIFGDTQVQTTEDVNRNWEAIKQEEKHTSGRESLLDGVLKHSPALLQAIDLQKKASKVGFDWNSKAAVLDKMKEEWEEYTSAESKREQEKELGDFLFTVANLARHDKIDAELVLQETNRKFRRRFTFLEEEAERSGQRLEKMPLEELEQWWIKAKEKERDDL